jgi:hypothetical protein
MASQHVPHSLIRDLITEIGQSAYNPVVAPTGILFGHLHDQRLQFRFDSRPARVPAVLGAIELLGNELPVPGQNGVGFGHAGDFGQEFAAESLADFSQSAPFRIG